MYKNKAADGLNNICGARIRKLRKKMEGHPSQRAFADMLQRAGLDVDKNAIQRIECRRVMWRARLSSLCCARRPTHIGWSAALRATRADYYAQNIRTEDVVFFKSGQFKAALAKTVDHLFGTSFQNEQQFNEGRVVTQDGFRFRLRQDDIAEVIGYSGSGKELDIPETVQGHVVTRVAPFAFSRQRQITAVSIPDTVDSIGQEAFYICPSLQQLKLPARLKIIGKNAFNYCRALKSVIVPTGTIHIDRHAFYDCTALKTISIPDTIGFMGEKVFGADGDAKVECTVVCRQDSYVEHYATENGILCSFV